MNYVNSFARLNINHAKTLPVISSHQECKGSTDTSKTVFGLQKLGNRKILNYST
jgi:hypothetical protein